MVESCGMPASIVVNPGRPCSRWKRRSRAGVLIKIALSVSGSERNPARVDGYWQHRYAGVVSEEHGDAIQSSFGRAIFRGEAPGRS